MERIDKRGLWQGESGSSAVGFVLINWRTSFWDCIVIKSDSVEVIHPLYIDVSKS